jgi:hypothetical protein
MCVCANVKVRGAQHPYSRPRFDVGTSASLKSAPPRLVFVGLIPAPIQRSPGVASARPVCVPRAVAYPYL